MSGVWELGGSGEDVHAELIAGCISRWWLSGEVRDRWERNRWKRGPGHQPVCAQESQREAAGSFTLTLPSFVCGTLTRFRSSRFHVFRLDGLELSFLSGFATFPLTWSLQGWSFCSSCACCGRRGRRWRFDLVEQKHVAECERHVQRAGNVKHCC